jgi:very-short-patch-repair endonuclease
MPTSHSTSNYTSLPLGEGRVREFAKAMRTDPTGGEKLMWYLLRNRRFKGYKFKRQFILDHYILDFYCIELKLAIEIDGPTHFTPEGITKDKQRDKYLNNKNITVFHIIHDELLANTHTVLDKLNTLTLALSQR